MAEILTIENLRVERAKTVILSSIDWKVSGREHWVILGPNGCGKTSLLKSLTGYLSPTSGTLRLLGRTYGQSDWRELRLKVGIVTSALSASIPAAEVALDTVVSGKYAQLDLWVRPTRADTVQASRLMRFVGATHLRERPWTFLSQGERQRVLIARALMARPRLLILDEPCAGLDPVAREEFLWFLNTLARRRSGPNLILVTHHAEEIMPAFTHALLLKAGAVASSGALRSVVTSRALSAAFGARIRVRRAAGRYEATLGHDRHRL